MEAWEELPGASDPHVLLVEDDPAARDLVRRHLTEHGYRLTAANDGTSAMALVRHDPADLVILDLGLAGAPGGFEVLDLLQADGVLAATPVLVVADSADREPLLRALKRGAHDYLAKPLDLMELEARCAAALRTKRLHDELRRANRRLEHEALTDELTGLANRRRALEELERAAAASRRHGRPLAVLIVDLDHFKDVNDSHGHAVGDAVLVESCRRFARTLRATDLIARFGGDEIIVMVSEAPPVQVALVGDRLRRSISEAPFELGEHTLGLSASVGWALWQGEEVAELIKRADEALYAAKASGRNAVHPLT